MKSQLEAALFAELLEVDETTRSTLHARLAQQAATAGILDIAYRTIDSPLGVLLLAATDHGLVRVAYAIEDHDRVLDDLATRISSRVLLAPARLDLAAREIDDYLAGRRRHFDLPLDLRLSTGFRRTVLDHLPDIPYGDTASYASVASAAGNPKAVRAVGSACATNPLPVVVPCHRVVRSDGTIGQYVGGSATKRTLLSLEAAGAGS
jgi:methylated-DNA-[protein]-cysteine S-methyltransferase